jgi:hypothetical protein
MAVEKEQLEAKLKHKMRKIRALEIMYRLSQMPLEGDVMEVTNGSQAAEISRSCCATPAVLGRAASRVVRSS